MFFASGIRNTEKLVVRPGTDEIWGMDHGSDWFGRPLEGQNDPHGQPITDLNPPDEMNHYVQGSFYGHPFLVGNRVPRLEYMNRRDIVELAARTTPPAWSTGAHWSPNAMIFYTGAQFPKDHRGDAFVAYHGSWNRQRKAGYCVARVLFDQGRPYGELVYVSFLTKEGTVLGRPVDVAVAPNGSLLISDDEGGRIYRLSYPATVMIPVVRLWYTRRSCGTPRRRAERVCKKPRYPPFGDPRVASSRSSALAMVLHAAEPPSPSFA